MQETPETVPAPGKDRMKQRPQVAKGHGVADGFVPQDEWVLVELVKVEETTRGKDGRGIALPGATAREHRPHVGWVLAMGPRAAEKCFFRQGDKVAFMLFSGAVLIDDPSRPIEDVRVVRAMDIMGHWEGKRRGEEEGDPEEAGAKGKSS